MTGFDLLLDKIRAVHQAINPGIFSSDVDKQEQSAVNAAVTVGQKMKSSFTEGLGKRKMAATNVGSARDHNKTTVPLTEHERGVISRLGTRGESPSDAEHDDDDNESTVSNDESICPNRTEGVSVLNDSDSDGDEDLTEDKRAKKSSLALKKMGNISRKPLNSMPPSTSLMLESYYW